MKTIYLRFFEALAALLLLVNNNGNAQSCTPLGNPNTYGTGNTWMGYIYQGKNFTTYKGYITEGNSSAAFDQSFGGAQVNFATNGCPVYTEDFSVRYRLTKNFAAANYTITVGGDDGYRLSLDGGATWAINNWGDHSYTTTAYTVNLSGNCNMVLEFYENGGENRVSFNAVVNCSGDGNPAQYGTGNKWIGYLYQGKNFDTYKGYVNEGTNANMNFDENFGGGGSPVTYNTSNCSVQTQNFSARYRLTKNFAAGSYMFTIGGDDGYRFSLDGGATWVINKWNDQSYGITTYTATLSGATNMVLEYYQNGGYARVSVSMSPLSLLPVKLSSFAALVTAPSTVKLNWMIAEAFNFDHFIVQRSADGSSFKNLQTIAAQHSTTSQAQNYAYTDQQAAGSNYYRLAMVDIDGAITYSNILFVQTIAAAGIKVYPTLVENRQLYIEQGTAAGHSTAMVFDMNGRKVAEQTLQNTQGRQSITLNASVKSGSYIVSVTDGPNQWAKQMIIVQ
jgi:Secretion system C-terminal sorting domain